MQVRQPGPGVSRETKDGQVFQKCLKLVGVSFVEARNSLWGWEHGFKGTHDNHCNWGGRPGVETHFLGAFDPPVRDLFLPFHSEWAMDIGKNRITQCVDQLDPVCVSSSATSSAGMGSPTKIDYRKKGYLYFLLSTGGPRLNKAADSSFRVKHPRILERVCFKKNLVDFVVSLYIPRVPSKELKYVHRKLARFLILFFLLSKLAFHSAKCC